MLMLGKEMQAVGERIELKADGEMQVRIGAGLSREVSLKADGEMQG